MDQSKKWRFRFGLRWLLLAVAACAVGSQIYVGDYSELVARTGALKQGMTRKQVHNSLGMKPDSGIAISGGRRCIREIYMEEKRNGEKVWVMAEYSMDGILQAYAVTE